MKGIIVGTIVTEDVLPLALVLMESFRRHNPDIPFHVLLASDLPVSLTGEHRGLKLLRSADLGFASLQQMFPGYDRKQTVVALKPFLLEHLLKASGGSAVFLDADILVTASLTPLFQQVAQHSLSVTPHISRTKSTPERRDLEHVLLLVGMYNAGFVGVSDREETWRFLDWWKRRLTTHCRNSIREGFHYDQRWLDLAPGLVADLHFVRDRAVTPLTGICWIWSSSDGAKNFTSTRSPCGFSISVGSIRPARMRSAGTCRVVRFTSLERLRNYSRNTSCSWIRRDG